MSLRSSRFFGYNRGSVEMKESSMSRNQQGFSLMEVMISLGLVSITALVFMYMTQQQSRSQASAMKTSEITRLISEVDRLLSDQGACTETLRGFSLNNSTDAIVAIRSADGIARITSGQASEGVIPRFFIEAGATVNRSAVEGNYAYGQSYLTIRAEFEKTQPYIGARAIIRRFHVMVNVCEDFPVHGQDASGWSQPCDNASGVFLERDQWSSYGNPSTTTYYGWCRTCPAAGNETVQLCE